MHFRDGKSRVIHHTIVRINSTSMIKNSSSFLKACTMLRRILWLSSHISLRYYSRSCSFRAKSARRRRCKVPLIIEEKRRVILLEQVGFQKNVPCSTHKILCIRRQSRIAATYTFGTRNSQGSSRNVGCCRAARCLRIVKITLLRQGSRFVL